MKMSIHYAGKQGVGMPVKIDLCFYWHCFCSKVVEMEDYGIRLGLKSRACNLIFCIQRCRNWTGRDGKRSAA